MNDINLYEKIPEFENGFPLKVRRYISHGFAPHWHEHLEILHILSGEGVFRCGAETHTARAGDTVIVNAGELHSAVAKHKADYLCLIANPTFFDDVNLGNTIFNTLVCDAQIDRIFREIFTEYERGTLGSDMLIKSGAYRIAARLLRNHSAARLSDKAYDMRLERLSKINRTLDFIKEHYTEKLTTSQLAGVCFLSESYFCRLFKSATGKTAISYINELRLEKAEVMLKNTSASVSEIAASVGFDDVNYFDRLFRKSRGMSPRRMRLGKG